MQNIHRPLWDRLVSLCKKHEQVIRYIIVGGLTTALNYAVYAGCLLLFRGNPSDYIIATAASFVVAVVFAYFANKHGVFHTKTESREDALREAGSFLMMRMISFGFELTAMWLLVDVLNANKWIAKIPVNVLIVALNYIFSKLFIFRKTENNARGNGEENSAV